MIRRKRVPGGDYDGARLDPRAERGLQGEAAIGPAYGVHATVDEPEVRALERAGRDLGDVVAVEPARHEGGAVRARSEPAHEMIGIVGIKAHSRSPRV